MSKVLASVHAESMKRANGLDGAIRIATQCVTSSDRDMHKFVPGGYKGGPVDQRNPDAVATKELVRLNGFWKEVKALLEKKKV